VVTVAAYTTNATDGANFPSLNLAPASAEYLWVRGVAQEINGDAAGALSVTTNFSELYGSGGTTGGAADTNMVVYGEYRIFTGSSNASAPSWSGTQADNASLYIALSEAPAAATWIPRGPMDPQLRTLACR
ncbi:MAG: hypothetical protein ACREXP_31005, partial [Steroidobacteraceae bacterium]